MTEKEWIDYCAASTDAPAIFHRFSRMVLGAALLENKVRLKWGHVWVYPNLWACIIAPSSTFRKSTVLNITRNVIEDINKFLLYPQEFSQERLIEAFALQSCGVMMAYEFQTLLGILGREYNLGLKALLTELYDCPKSYQRQIKKLSFEIVQPCISLFAATTSDWLLERAQEGDFRGGFLSRFLFIPAFKKEVTYYVPKSSDPQRWKYIMSQAVRIRKMETPGDAGMTLEADAEAHFVEWMKNHEDFERYAVKVPPVLDSYWIRLETSALKLAIIEACWRGQTNITHEIMEASTSMIEQLKAAMMEFYGAGFAFSPYQVRRQNIMRILKRSTTLTRQALLAESQLSAFDFNNTIDTLREAGEIAVSKSEQGVEHFSLEEKNEV